MKNIKLWLDIEAHQLNNWLVSLSNKYGKYGHNSLIIVTSLYMIMNLYWTGFSLFESLWLFILVLIAGYGLYIASGIERMLEGVWV